jgi:hypothetical protein
MPLAIRELTRSAATRHVMAALGVGLLLGFIGPFGTYPAFDRVDRYALWLALTLAGYLSVLAAAWAISVIPRAARLSFLPRSIAVAAASALPMTFFSSWLFGQFQPGRSDTIGELPLLYIAVATVQWVLALIALHQAMNRSPGPVAHQDQAEPATTLFARIPAELGRDLIALEAEDHYLRVHTRAGSGLILYRFSDALAHLDPAKGLRVHRGWWVARDAVLGTTRDGDRLSLMLANGLKVPVSRAHAAAVRGQQWPAYSKLAGAGRG